MSDTIIADLVVDFQGVCGGTPQVVHTSRSGLTISRGESSGDIWTPQVFIDAVGKKFGPIDIDLAALATNSKGLWYINPERDSLTVEWNRLSQPEYAVDVMSKSQRTLSISGDEARMTSESLPLGVVSAFESTQNLSSGEGELTQLTARYCWLKSVSTLHLRRAENGNVGSRLLITTDESNERGVSHGTGLKSSGSGASAGGATLVPTVEGQRSSRRTISSPSLTLIAPEQFPKTLSRPVQDVTHPSVIGTHTDGAKIKLPSSVSSFTYSPLCFLNPPYSNITPWARKCAMESVLGAKILLLVPGSIGANWYWNWVEPFAKVISVGRMVFDNCSNKRGELVTTPYPKDLILCVYPGYIPIVPMPRIERWRWQNER